MDWPTISSRLRQKGLLTQSDATCQPLPGGVSSDICLITDGTRKFVLKQALAQLKVKDHWTADLSRNQVEQDFIHLAERLIPGSVPQIIYSDTDNGFFLMEFLDASYENWKVQLMRGQFEQNTTRQVGRMLATIHSQTQEDARIAAKFDTTSNFKGLRIEPYLITCGNRNPELKILFDQEAARLERHRQALVHGDYSPKNIMVGTERIVLLDHEVAWYGDPAFDLAFLLTHLFFKSLIHRPKVSSLPNLAEILWREYQESGEIKRMEELALRAGKLQLMIMLARIDGKSPVEYWDPGSDEAKLVRQFVYELLPAGRFDPAELNTQWFKHLST